MLRAAGRDHVQNVAALPGLLRDAVRGTARVRRRRRSEATIRTWPRCSSPADVPQPRGVARRTFATASLSLAEVKETAKHLGVTFNDIILAMAAGGLRELLLRYDGRADRPIFASVPVATDRSADRITGNEISGLAVSLPVHIDDPLERVRLTRSPPRAKEDNEFLGPKLHGRMMEYLPPPLAPALFRWQSKRAAHNKHHERRRLERARPA